MGIKIGNVKMKLMQRIGIVVLMSILMNACKSVATVEGLSIKDRQLWLNNKAYIIKGVCYNPVPVGSNLRDFNKLSQDLLLMKEAGINTIRVYAPIDDTAVLDEIAASGIKIIMGIGYNQGGRYDLLSGSFLKYIAQFKNHKAILFWELGNEYNYHPEWFEGDLQNWYTSLNKAAGQIHEIDPKHLVATAHGEVPDVAVLNSCPNIDIWGLNVYRWDNPETVFKEWSLLSKKPMYLSEAGADSYMTVSKANYHQGINEQAQADATAHILDATLNASAICSGITLFSFSDEWWKAGNNDRQDAGGWAPNSSGVPYDGTPNEEYWGIVDVERNKKMAYEVVKQKFTKNDK